MSKLRIGIVGVGNIGKTLAIKLSAAGHNVKVANSRGPETITSDITATGARPVDMTELMKELDVLIISIPLNQIPMIAQQIKNNLSSETVLIDTSNYYPFRDTNIPVLDGGQVESVWVEQQLGHPIAKAWNCIYTKSFDQKGSAAGSKNRICLPVAADRDRDRKLTMELVDATGFDAFAAGPISDSWRQQPGTPVYCTDLTRDQLPLALAKAEKDQSPIRRDLLMSEKFSQKVFDVQAITSFDSETVVQHSREYFKTFPL